MQGIERDTLFVALTRPQMFAGVTYSYFIANAVIATELFLIFKSIWALAVALIVHLVGVIMCLREPRAFDLRLTRVSHRSKARGSRRHMITPTR